MAVNLDPGSIILPYAANVDVRDYIKVEELMEFRLEAARAFNDALISESRVEHDKSHLLESYGALILAMEEAFYSLKT